MQLAKAHDAIVIDADYRKAPEHPHPACINDAEDVVRWTLEQSFTDTSQVTLTGFSAGGNIALVLAGSSDILPKGTIKHAIAVYPVVDLSKGYIDDSHRRCPDNMPGMNNEDFSLRISLATGNCHQNPDLFSFTPSITQEYSLAHARSPTRMLTWPRFSSLPAPH